jgi:HEAT repeat protein/S1-C subfamily serine protease
MPLRLTCPECDTVNTVGEEKRGKRIRCRECESLITVPLKARAAAKTRDEDEDEDDAPPPPKKKPAAAVTRSKPRPTRRDEDEDEDEDEGRDKPRPRKGKKEQGSPLVLILVLVGVGVVLAAGGAVAGLYYLFKDDDKPSLARTTPTGPVGPAGMGGFVPPNGGGAGDVNPPPVNPGVAANVNPPPINPGVADKGKRPPAETKTPDPVPSTPVGGGGGQVSSNTVFQYVLKSSAWIITKQALGGSMGSGSLIDRENRLVLTNYHVVHGLTDFVVFFPVYNKEGRLIRERDNYLKQVTREDAIKGKVLSHDSRRDLALIQLDRVPPGIEALPFAPREVETGDNLHSVGNPGASDALWVYTPGKVRSVADKKWQAGGGGFILNCDAKVVEATSPTNPGDSGGPCVNDRGELVGITHGGMVGGVNAISIFIERSMAEDFINKTFAAVPALRGQSWVRAKRPPIAVGGSQKVNLPDLVDKLTSTDVKQRREGANGLALLGPDARLAIPQLVRALEDQDDFVQRAAEDALKQIGSPTKEDADRLVKLLPKLSSVDAKVYVLGALALHGGNADAAAEALRASSDADARVRQQALRAVGRMADVAEKDARGALEKGLNDADRRVRSAAAEGLTANVPGVAKDVKQLTLLLKHKEPEVRAAAAMAVGRLGEGGKTASPELMAALNDDDRDLRRSALVALKAIGAEPKDIVPHLRKAIKDSDPRLRQAALEMAGKAGAAAKELVPMIAEELSDAEIRRSVLATLKQLGPEAREGAGHLASLLGIDKDLRSETLEVLEAMKLTGPAVTPLVPKLIEGFAGETRAPVREKLANLLGKMGTPALRPLVEGLRNSSPDVRRGVASALGSMGKLAVPAVRDLTAAAQSETNLAARNEELAAIKRIAAAGASK